MSHTTKTPIHFWLMCLPTVIIGALVISQVGAYLGNYFLSHLPSGENISKVIFILALVAISYFCNIQRLKNHFWALEGNTLIRGRPVNLKIELDKVREAFWYHISSAKYLILEFEENKYFVLDLYELGNGANLMKLVEENLDKKIISLQECSDQTKLHWKRFKSVKRNSFVHS